MKIYHSTNGSSHRFWLFLTMISSILGIVFGFFGYNQVDGFGGLNSIYFTIRLFFLNFDVPFNEPYPTILEWGRWFAFFTFFSSLIQVGIKLFHNQFRNVLLMFLRKHYVIVGINEYSINLAKDLLKQRIKVVITDTEANEHDIGKILASGGNVIIGNLSDTGLLKMMQLHNTSHIIIFSMNDTNNLNYCLNVKSYFEKLQVTQAIKLSVHLHEKQLDSFVEFFNKEVRDFLDLSIFNVFENCAQLLFEEHPIYKNSNYQNLDILIIELNEIGQSVLAHFVQLANFGVGRKISVTIISNKIEEQLASLRLRYPQIENVCDLNFVRENQNLPHLLEEMKETDKRFTNIYICYSDEQEALIASQQISHYFSSEIYTYVYNANDLELARWIEKDKGSLKNIYFFGAISKIGSKKVIIEENLEKLAKQIHKEYLKSSGKDIPWSHLSMFEKLSNRSQANHIDIKLYMLGLKSEVDTGFGITENEYFEIVENKLEIIGQAEHERWNAVHFVNGWKKCEPESKKNSIKKLHPCLVPWSELDHVSLINAEDYKKYDFDTVRNIHTLLTASGMQLVKREIV